MDYREYPEAVEWAEGALSDLLVSMEDDELIKLHNKSGQYPEIWAMSEFDTVAGSLTPTELVDNLAEGFSTYDEWFTTDQEDRFCSFTSLGHTDAVEIPIYRIIKDILRYMDSYGNDDVADILSQMKEEWV